MLYWMTISSLCVAPAIYFSWIDERNSWEWDILWGTLVALCFSWIMNYVIGSIHYCFIRRRRDHPAYKVVDAIALLTTIAFFACAMVAVIDMERDTDAGLWIVCFLIAWALDNFIFDVIVAILGRFKLFRKWFQIRGHYVDSREQYQTLQRHEIT